MAAVVVALSAPLQCPSILCMILCDLETLKNQQLFLRLYTLHYQDLVHHLKLRSYQKQLHVTVTGQEERSSSQAQAEPGCLCVDAPLRNYSLTH